MEVMYHDNVLTSDGLSLGVAQRRFRYDGEDYLETQGFREFLKTFDFDTGDDFYVPLDFVKSRNEADQTVMLSIKFKAVQELTLSRKPRAIAYDMAQVIELPR